MGLRPAKLHEKASLELHLFNFFSPREDFGGACFSLPAALGGVPRSLLQLQLCYSVLQQLQFFAVCRTRHFGFGSAARWGRQLCLRTRFQRVQPSTRRPAFSTLPPACVSFPK